MTVYGLFRDRSADLGLIRHTLFGSLGAPPPQTFERERSPAS
jgi:hypothetical protein